MKTTLPVLRRSAIQTAESCLYRFNQVWNLGTPDSSDFSLKGIAFHSCAHQYILRLVDRQLPADHEEALDAFREGIASVLTPPHLVPEVREMFRRWAERFELDLSAFVATEEHQMGNTQQTFTPDLVYARPTGVEVVDWKTFWHPWTETQIKGDFQARWYLYNAMRIWPNFPSYTFTHAYVRFGSSLSVQFQQSDFDAFEAEVEAVGALIAEATARDEWPATAGKECSYCELRCPLADHPAIVPKRFTIPEQAQTVAAWILAAETQLKAAKKALKTYCAANGPVDVQGVEWDNRPVMQRSYPIDVVLDEMRKVGVDADSATLAADNFSLTISHSALSKIFRVYPGLETALQAAQKQKLTYRFSARKPGVGDDEDES